MRVANIFACLGRLRGAIAVSIIITSAIIVPDQTKEVLVSYLDRSAELQTKFAFMVSVAVTVTLYFVGFAATTYAACVHRDRRLGNGELRWPIDPWRLSVALGLLPLLSLVQATSVTCQDELQGAFDALVQHHTPIIVVLLSAALGLLPSIIGKHYGPQQCMVCHSRLFWMAIPAGLGLVYLTVAGDSSLVQFAKFLVNVATCPPAFFAVQAIVLVWWVFRRSRSFPKLRLVASGVHIVLLAAVAPFSAFCLLFLISPVFVPSVIAPVGLLFCFGLCLVVALNFLVMFTAQTGIPGISGLVVIALVSSALNLNDNHQVRSVGPDVLQDNVASQSERPSTNDFSEWLDKRPDRSKFAETKYPVYIVAAAGGGAYAGYYSAIFLAKMQDECPGFASHIFAISAVSGGSVGSSLFYSILEPTLRTDNRFGCTSSQPERSELTEYTREFFSEDFLSPLLAATLFPDFVQRFIPLPIESLDRARSLERSLEISWSSIFPNKTNPYLSPMGHWSPDTARPALFLNATDVETGSRVVISPLTISFSKWHPEDLSPAQRLGVNEQYQGEIQAYSNRHFAIDYLVDLNAPQNLSLATAASISARFPFVTPPATVTAELPLTGEDGENVLEKVRLRLVDGGYNDNSGVATALDIIDSIERATDPKVLEQVQINLLMLDVRRPTAKDLKLDASSRSALSGFAEILSPIDTLAGIRQARLVDTVNAATERLDRDYGSADPIAFKRVRGAYIFSARGDDLTLLYKNFRIKREALPLGWRLSRGTKDQIENSAFDGCSPSRNMIFADSNNELSYRTSMSDPYADASCVKWMIEKELSGKMAEAQAEISKSVEYENFPGIGACAEYGDEFPGCEGF
ncbi:hypothetical protein FHX06_006344 [Rhizobium sp. BK512]|uniref:hypothetical protein n=1 Tax=Rhizobium sp. BK512 TaxID=2587010 RepID=UPI000DE0E4C8|nr:hypothetical protein [Rhizobium sp. BK512]MBB3564974.1 hypothetical protein [Rhizobium sp. BK512]